MRKNLILSITAATLAGSSFSAMAVCPSAKAMNSIFDKSHKKIEEDVGIALSAVPGILYWNSLWRTELPIPELTDMEEKVDGKTVKCTYTSLTGHYTFVLEGTLK